MPFHSGHVFASHIGHSGKTTLCFNMSCHWAKSNPDISVLVMDLAEEGDLTKRLLGGVDNCAKVVDDVFGSVFNLISDANSKSSGVMSWMWASDVDVTKHAVHVAEHNKNVPDNLYLVSSGAWPRDETDLDNDKRKALCTKIRGSLERSSTTWKLFCDTDGDRRPSPFTMIGYCLCPYAIIPMHLNKSDLDRIQTMFGLMNEYRQMGAIETQVLLVIWNMVKSQKDEPMSHQGIDLPFTPSKVSKEILSSCNKRLARIAADPQHAGLFVRGSPETPDEEFLKGTVYVMRQLADNVLKPAEEMGLPFVEMAEMLKASGKKSLPFDCDGVSYSAGADVIHSVDDAVRQLTDKFSSMAVDAGAGGSA